MFCAKAEIAAPREGLGIRAGLVPFENGDAYQPKHPEVLRINPKRQVPGS
jgi:glutathione S-transferase